MPLRIAHPVNVTLTTRVRLPADWSELQSDNTVRAEAFTAIDKISISGRDVTMTFGWESLRDHLPADRVAAHVTELDRVRNTLGYHLTHDGAITAQAASGPAQRFRFNWLPVVLILVAGAGLFYLARRLFATKRTPPPLPVFDPQDKALTGLGGWLLVVGLGVLLRPVLISVQLVKSFGFVFDLGKWELLTTPGTPSYHSLYAPLLVIEVLGNTLTLGLGLLLIPLFFLRKRTFPKVFIGVLIFSIIFLSVDAGFAAKITPGEKANAEAVTEIARLVISSLIWIPYMLYSRRVKLTFTR
jgi:Protein of unknown function (DUF2569)